MTQARRYRGLINGTTLLLCSLLLSCGRSETQNSISRPDTIKAVSGYHFQSPETQALQDDTFANPGMLWVDRGEELWHTSPQPDQPSCASCHHDAATSMAGVAAQYPRFSRKIGALTNIEGQINYCRTSYQNSDSLPYESAGLLSLTAYVAHQSKGMPIKVAIEAEAAPAFAAGEAYFYTRRGQLNLACNHCHEDNVGRMLRGDKLSQGQAGGYPIYRLEWQTLGSLHRRLRFCNTGVRAEPFEYGAKQYINLELYLKWRASGLPVETPAVRR